MKFGFGKPSAPAQPAAAPAPASTPTVGFGGLAPGAAGAPAAGGADLVKETTTAGFTKDVIEGSKHALVLVDFWADWCGPCKQLTPLIEKVVRSYGGKVRLVKLNVDQHPSIPGQLRIQSLPTVYAFRDGRPLDGFMGLQPETTIRAFIDKLLGEEGAADLVAALEAADKALDGGDLQGAAEIYAAILQEDRQNVGAIAERRHGQAGGARGSDRRARDGQDLGRGAAVEQALGAGDSAAFG